MKHHVFILSALIGLSGCASRSVEPPTCDGLHRRDANPHGSVLTDRPVSTSPEKPSARASLPDPQSFAACRGGQG